MRDTLGTGRRILFSENKGQWEPQVLFRSQMHTTTLFVEHDCFTFVVQHPDNDNLKHFPCDYTQKGRYRQHCYRIGFVGSIAFHFQDLLKESLSKYGLTLGMVLKAPAEGLVQYYK